ncbi:unnamed protein product [Nippostrongylus brasiliensis]|uniref:DUF5641 domain-containing protein n=1 Tax=Nippostrongylus brasiliensis TaxID=27835 RepID=A0A0N4YU14_NIPBR|nr:unnamed protein product [Nippostrongylus brasiliensis]
MLALASSVKNADRFWEQWQHQYLTSLREQHTRTASSKRGSRITPKVGQIVLICDAIQPRHSWKQGRIDELRQDHEGAIREAVIMLPSKRKIRRPLNLLATINPVSQVVAVWTSLVHRRIKDKFGASANQEQQIWCIGESRAASLVHRRIKSDKFGASANQE